MGSGIPDIAGIVGDFIKTVLDFFDDAYQNGYLLMFLGIVIMVVIVVLVFG